MSSLKIVKNAFANLCRGGASALVVLLLPPFLTRILDKDAYGTWLLILQLSTYVSFLDFGVQTAVGRFVAHCNELGDTKQRDSIVSTSIAILSGAAVLAMVGISILAWQLPYLFKDMPANLHQDARLALLCVGGSLAVSLPFSVFGAIFVGLQRYDVPAWIIGISKLLGGIFVVLVAQSSHSIVMMAVVMGIANLCTGLWQFIAYKKMVRYISISVRSISNRNFLEISSYCFSLSVWNVAMLLIGGLDAAIIGYFDYQSVIYYVLASSFITFIFGIQNSIISTIMPQAAVIGAKGDRKALENLLISSTRYVVVIMLVIGLPVLAGGKWFLTLWVGDLYAEKTFLLLQLLIVGNFIRQIGTPYSILSLAVGEQKQILLSPIVEGLVNVLFSMIFTSYIGFIGVSLGTIFGGCASITMHFFYNLPRSFKIKVEDEKKLLYTIFKPFPAIMPCLLFLLIDNKLNLLASIIAFIISIVVSYTMIWHLGIVDFEKRMIINKIKHRTALLFNPSR